MATELLKTVTELLNEEKWTRATLNSYTITNFKDLDVLIEQGARRGHRRGGAGAGQRAPEAHQQLHHRPVPLGDPRPVARAGGRLEPGHADQHLHGQPQVERRGVPLAADPRVRREQVRPAHPGGVLREQERGRAEARDLGPPDPRRLRGGGHRQGPRGEARGGRGRRGGGRLLQEGHPPLHQQEAVRQRQGAVGQADRPRAPTTSTSSSTSSGGSPRTSTASAPRPCSSPSCRTTATRATGTPPSRS